MSRSILEMRGITKTFPGVVALDGVDLDIAPGEVHAVVGENGAGKSTLMKILSGAYQRDAGSIFLNGEPANISAPADAIRQGIGIVYQDLPLAPALSVLANIYLGREETTRLGKIDRATHLARYERLCDSFGIYLPPDSRIRDLSVAERQLVEILKVLDRDVQVIVMDEPTATLDQNAKQALFQTVRQLQTAGKSFIFITHFIDEIFEIADRVTILKDGCRVDTLEIDQTSPQEVVAMMIGHSPRDMFPEKAGTASGKPILQLREINAGARIRDFSMTLHQGEILGLTGLVGSGCSDIGHLIIGNLAYDSGAVLLDGEPTRISSPYEAIKRGICLLPSDRKGSGLLLDFELAQNVSLSSIEKISPRQVIQFQRERQIAAEFIEQLRIVTPSARQRVRNLSGGNQQKVVLARMLHTDARILVLDEPTQGIDVRAKEEIFLLMRQLAGQGKAILFISSEFKEIAGVADRGIVLRNGAITAALERDDISEARLVAAATML